ncbi:MAG: hypothetical protein L0Y62_07705 [Nitrospirae bacterium]|nr:hypothetical protein [Nitrospirota bacterium]
MTCFICIVCGVFAADSQGQDYPYGDYSRGGKGKGYGEKNNVTSKDDAKKALNKYYENRDVKAGGIKEREFFYESEIKDKDNNIVDRVIIDKRTGRIRSTQ